MEGSGVLAPELLASHPPNDGKPSKAREEGELTSSDEDPLPPCSSAPSVSASDSAFPSKSTSDLGGKSSVQGVKLGKSTSASQSGSANIQSQKSSHLVTVKGLPKHPEPFKLNNPQWHKPHGGNSNLVISFSDDDSGSDTELPRKAFETDRRLSSSQVVHSASKQPSIGTTPSVTEATRKTTSNEGKTLPKKVALSQRLGPSIPRSNIPKPRNMWSSAIEQRPHSTNSNPVSRNVAVRGSGRSKSVDLSDSKLQDLRQQIALRENELKLKAVQLHKENSLEPSRDFCNINQRNPAPRRSRDISSDAHLEPKEPEAKRKRPSSDVSAQLSRGFHEKTSEKYVLPSKEVAAKCVNPQDTIISANGHHDGQIAQTELLQGSMRMQMSNEQLPPLLTNPNATGQDGQGFSASCSLSDWMSKSRSNLVVSNPKLSVADMSFLNLPKTSVVEKAKQSSRTNGTGPSSSSGNRAMDETNKCKDQKDVYGKPERFKYDSNLPAQAIQTSPNDASATAQRHRGTNQGCDDTDVQSLFALEEFHDKQLEEAQEHRHRCEIEERNALKAYLKSQRALAEANAQCSYLYRKRELFSARLCSLLMDNPTVFLSSQQQEEFGDPWNLSNNVSEVNLDLIPSTSDQIHGEHDAGNQVGYDSNVQSVDGDAQQIFSPIVDRNNLGSEACSEPDASTSELQPHKNKDTSNGFLSPSNDLNVSSDECEEMHAIQGKNDIIGDSTMRFPVDSARESILLEAYLRSKLVSRLETITSLRKNGVSGKRNEGIVQLPDADTRSGSEMNLDNIPSQPGKEQFCEHASASGDQPEVSADGHTKDDEGIAKPQLETDNGLHSGLEGLEEAERDLSAIQQIKEHSLNIVAERSHGTANPECIRPQTPDDNQLLSLFSIFRSAFYHVKGAYATNCSDMRIFNQQDGICYPYNDKRVDCMDSVRDSLVGGIDSYSCNSLIDPLWPLCIYELRGRCNNEECPWQHVRDYTISNLLHQSPGSADSVTGSSSNSSNQKAGEPSHILTPPAYLLSVDSLKADSQTSGYIVDRKSGPSWLKIVSIGLFVPSFLERHLSPHEPVLHGNYGCIEIRGNQLYLQSRNYAMSPLKTDLSDYNQVLETALLTLNQESDKTVGTRKSLALLSRGLEADPASLHLWVVYLLIYYSDRNSVEDDALFSCAVKNNEASYELWVMYIKSRKQLKDQLSAYDRALSTLCHYAHGFDGDAMRASACILDLFLQMLHCFCMSGNVERAIKRIHRLTDGVKDPDSQLHCDILQCLGVFDKCVFWVCCAYLLMYKKLPDAIVGMFEFHKDISLIDWPCVHKTTEEKQLIYKLMEMAEDSMNSHVDQVSPEKSAALRATHVFALNHVKLVAALDSFESCKGILENYSNQYSSCLEVALLAARFCSQSGEGSSFLGFEEALSKWPREVPGIQCIWNQFAEFALHNGGCDVGKEIMLRWYDSVSKAHCSQNKLALEGDIVDNNRDLYIEMFCSDASELVVPGSKDAVFGLLNLSLYRLLQKDVEKAYLAVDKAMKTAHDDFRHCIREHATFLLNYGSQVGKNVVSLAGLLEILKAYISHTNSCPVSEPLTRKFIQQIPKPRPRQLVRELFYSISPDFSTVNLVLETWFGPSLLPQGFNKMKELVDFVEAVLELSPCNYPLAITTCKLLLSKEIDAASTLFWARSLLVNTIYQSVPLPPEYVWVEAAGLLSERTTVKEATVSESFHRRALSVYPFSMNLWKSLLKQSVSADSRASVMEAAKEKGIELPLTSIEGEKEE